MNSYQIRKFVNQIDKDLYSNAPSVNADEAYEILKSYIAKNPIDIETWLTLAILTCESCHWEDEAIEIATEAWKYHSDSRALILANHWLEQYYGYGLERPAWAYIHQQAEDLLNLVPPDNVRISGLLHLIHVYYVQSTSGEASSLSNSEYQIRNALELCVESDPELIRAWAYLCRLELKNKNYKGALRCREAALKAVVFFTEAEDGLLLENGLHYSFLNADMFIDQVIRWKYLGKDSFDFWFKMDSQ